MHRFFELVNLGNRIIQEGSPWDIGTHKRPYTKKYATTAGAIGGGASGALSGAILGKTKKGKAIAALVGAAGGAGIGAAAGNIDRASHKKYFRNKLMKYNLKNRRMSWSQAEQNVGKELKKRY